MASDRKAVLHFILITCGLSIQNKEEKTLVQVISPISCIEVSEKIPPSQGTGSKRRDASYRKVYTIHLFIQSFSISTGASIRFTRIESCWSRSQSHFCLNSISLQEFAVELQSETWSTSIFKTFLKSKLLLLFT